MALVLAEKGYLCWMLSAEQALLLRSFVSEACLQELHLMSTPMGRSSSQSVCLGGCIYQNAAVGRLEVSRILVHQWGERDK